MSDGRGTPGIWGLKLLDGLQYAVAVNGIVVLALAPVSVVATGSLVALKWVLFLLGLALIGYGPLKLRPPLSPAHRSRVHVDNTFAEEGFGARVGELPPVSLLEPAPKEHLSDGGRLFLAGIVAWVVSFLMEAVLRVGVPTVG